MWQPLESLNIFNTVTWKQFFWKNENFSKKIEYCFLVESTKIENTDVKSNKMESTKLTYHKKQSFVSNYLFQFENSCPNAHSDTFCKHWKIIWRCFFSLSILKFYPFHCHVFKSTVTWKRGFIKKKMNGCSFQQVLWQNLSWFLA